jgi:hypothetical protein
MRQNPILQYANGSFKINQPIPHSIIRGALVAGLILALLLGGLHVLIEYENAHSENFFPRRVERPGSKHYARFGVESVRDEKRWRDFQVMITQDERWYGRTLTDQDRKLMQSWIADRERWNRFVILVKCALPIELAFFPLTLLVEMFLLVSTSQEKSRSRLILLGKVLIGIVIIVVSYRLLAFKYISIFFPD